MPFGRAPPTRVDPGAQAIPGRLRAPMNAISHAAVRPATAATHPNGLAPRLVTVLIALMLVLMVVPEGFDYRQLTEGEAPLSGGPISRLFWLTLLGAGAGAIAWRAGSALRLTREAVNPFLIAFVVLAVMSLAWSIDPTLTLRRLVRVFAIVLASAMLVLVGWHPRPFQNLVRPVLTLLLLGSILLAVLAPELGVHHETEGVLLGAWHGLANHKNSLGNLACIALIFWVHAALAREKSMVTVLFGLGIALVCLVFARSSTAWMNSVLSLLFLLMLMRPPPSLRRYTPVVVGLFVSALLMYSLVILDVLPGVGRLLGPIAQLTGKELSFTGRTDIWALITLEIERHPWLGAGFGAYWAGPRPETAAYVFVRELGFYPASAHSGYLDVVNDLGLAGLLVLLGYLGHYLRQSLQLLVLNRPQAALMLALFLQQAITNLSESRWLNVQSVDFVIMTLATLALARLVVDARRQRVRQRAMATDVAETADHALAR